MNTGTFGNNKNINEPTCLINHSFYQVAFEEHLNRQHLHLTFRLVEFDYECCQLNDI